MPSVCCYTDIWAANTL